MCEHWDWAVLRWWWRKVCWTCSILCRILFFSMSCIHWKNIFSSAPWLCLLAPAGPRIWKHLFSASRWWCLSIQLSVSHIRFIQKEMTKNYLSTRWKLKWKYDNFPRFINLITRFNGGDKTFYTTTSTFSM